MKTLLATLALATMTATASFAMTLSAYDQAAIRSVAPEVALNGLSDAQARTLSGFAQQGDIGSLPGAADFIRSVVNN